MDDIYSIVILGVCFIVSYAILGFGVNIRKPLELLRVKVSAYIHILLENIIMIGKCRHVEVKEEEYDYCQFKGSFKLDRCIRCGKVTRKD